MEKAKVYVKFLRSLPTSKQQMAKIVYFNLVTALFKELIL